jgi:hypothetical protein
MGTPFTTAGRLCALLAIVVLVVSAAAATGCGSDDDGSGGAAAEDPAPASTGGFPRPQSRSFRALIGDMLQGPALAPSVSVLDPGRNRFGFALFDRGNRQIGDLDVALYVSKGVDETVHGPYGARYLKLDVKPQFRSQTSAEDPDTAQSVYAAELPFSSPGSYLVSAVMKLDGRFVATSPAQLRVSGSNSVPEVGEKAISVHTPTVASAHGNIKSIDTRVPPDDMHDVDLADALADHRPVVLLFATPALCQSRVCGPVTDIAEQVKSELGDKADFIHMEIYRDNDIAKGARPQVPAWGLCSRSAKGVTCTEPWLFTIDKAGRVAARLQGAFSAGELEDAVHRALR